VSDVTALATASLLVMTQPTGNIHQVAGTPAIDRALGDQESSLGRVPVRCPLTWWAGGRRVGLLFFLGGSWDRVAVLLLLQWRRRWA